MRRELLFGVAQHAVAERGKQHRGSGAERLEAMTVANKYDQDYWDGDRIFGDGGYRYDGRWLAVARDLVKQYGLVASSRVLEIGCGKAFLLNDLLSEVPGITVAGVDISPYAIKQAPETVRKFLTCTSATNIPYEDSSFDLVISFCTIENFTLQNACTVLSEIQRVSAGDAYVLIQSYHDDNEFVGLLDWQLVMKTILGVEEWKWLFSQCGYSGDYGFACYKIALP